MSEEKQMVDLKVQVAKTVTIVRDAKTVIINDQPDYENAVKMLRDIKEYRTKLDDIFKPIQQKTKEANQLALKNINAYKIPLDEAERIIRSSMGKYVAIEESKRHAKEERIRKEAEEKERELLKKDLEECGLNKTEAKEEAEKMEVITPEITIEDNTKTVGISYMTKWRFTIEDISKIPAEYMMPDEKKIAGVIKAMKEHTNIPGIKIHSEKVPIVR